MPQFVNTIQSNLFIERIQNQFLFLMIVHKQTTASLTVKFSYCI